METKFDQDEFLFAYPNGIENNYWNIARNKIIHNTIKKFPVKKMIDVGAGRGIVTGFLFRNGIAIRGVELGSTTPISNSGAPVTYNTDVLSISETSEYNAAGFFDVIEHIENPVAFVKSVVTHFDNVEYLIITVPSRKELWSNFDEYYGHFRRYDLNSLQHEVQQMGFRILTCRYFFHSLYLVIRLNNLFTKNRSLQFHAPKGVSKIIHSLIGSILFMEKFFIPGKLYGSSIICIAQKVKK